jgi:hypothetical protein
MIQCSGSSRLDLWPRRTARSISPNRGGAQRSRLFPGTRQIEEYAWQERFVLPQPCLDLGSGKPPLGAVRMADSRHRWQFAARFRRNAFGWRSQPAIARVHEAVVEIRKMARRDPVLAAEGAVLFLEKVSPALEHVDSSSGAIGTAVNHAIEELVSIIAKAPVDLGRRARWLERLWDAYAADAIPYIETLGECWGELCVTRELASIWADNLVDLLRANWSEHKSGSYFQGTPVCLSSLLAAGRYQELMDLLEKSAVCVAGGAPLGSAGVGRHG